MIRDLLLSALVIIVACLGLPDLGSTANAQQPSSPRRVGVLAVSFSAESQDAKEFRKGLVDAGYAEGRDVVIEWRYADGDYARVPQLAADLVQRKVDVIVVQSTPAAQAVRRA